MIPADSTTIFDFTRIPAWQMIICLWRLIVCTHWNTLRWIVHNPVTRLCINIPWGSGTLFSNMLSVIWVRSGCRVDFISSHLSASFMKLQVNQVCLSSSLWWASHRDCWRVTKTTLRANFRVDSRFYFHARHHDTYQLGSLERTTLLLPYLHSIWQITHDLPT